MNTTTWIDAPAGFSGSAGVGFSLHACPSAVAGGTGVLLAPVAAPVRGTGVPAAVRMRVADERGAAFKSSLQSAVIGIAPLSITTENIGTTLGIHPPGRPQS